MAGKRGGDPTDRPFNEDKDKGVGSTDDEQGKPKGGRHGDSQDGDK
ncbi:hypothetical protein ACWEPC_44020 [Nonomuraea sp. NPDC004297]